jgi:hypothetical protein
MIYYQSQSRIHKIHNNHGCTTTMNWFRRTCKESKITLYYWPHTMIMMQFTGLLSIHFTSLIFCFSFLQKPAWFTGHEKNPPNKCAKITRQKDPPVKSAMKTCQIYVRLKPAEFTRWKNPPFQLADCLPENLPSPLRIPRQDLARHPSPPPPRQLRQWSRGEGAGSQPGPPTHPEQVLLLSFPFSWMATYSYVTQHIHILHRVDQYESITILL